MPEFRRGLAGEESAPWSMRFGGRVKAGRSSGRGWPAVGSRPRAGGAMAEASREEVRNPFFPADPSPRCAPPRTPEIGWHAYRGGVSCEIRFLEIRL